MLIKKTIIVFIVALSFIILCIFKFNKFPIDKMPENFTVMVKQNKTHVELCTINKKDKMYKQVLSIINDNAYFWTLTLATYAPSTELVSNKLSINVLNDAWIVHHKDKYYGAIHITKKTNVIIKDFC
jgi:hypothetical protein